RELADDGRSLVCITHNVDNVDQCHLVLILARGKLIFCGPPKEAPRWFKVPHVSDIYDRIAQRDLADWEREFVASDLHREFVANRLASVSAPAALPPKPAVDLLPAATGLGAGPADPGLSLSAISGKLFPPLADRFRQLEAGMLRVREWLHPIVDAWHQFRVLTARYVELTWSDPRSLRLVLLQAPLVAAFLLLGFLGKPFHRPMPLLRPLDDGERRTLLILRGVGELIDGKKELTAAQREALRKVRLSVAGVDAAVDGSGLVGLLRALQSDTLTASQRAALDGTQVTLGEGEDAVTVSVGEASRAWKRFQRSDIPEKLLNVSGPVVPTQDWYDPRFGYTLLFILSVVVMWFGCNNAAREIVKEEAILARERAVNLRLLPYLASKFVVLGAVTTLQVGLLMVLVYGPLEWLAANVPGHTVPPPQLAAGYGVQFGVFALLGLVGVALGLAISAAVATAERANALLPYAIIPQMILGGGFMEVGGPLAWVAGAVAPVYWAYRAVHLGASVLPEGFPGHRDGPDGWLTPCVWMAGQGVALLAVTYGLLRRR
ncbi:MAG: ABC transporter permease, partial [Gemmataceae bacterium]